MKKEIEVNKKKYTPQDWIRVMVSSKSSCPAEDIKHELKCTFGMTKKEASREVVKFLAEN